MAESMSLFDISMNYKGRKAKVAVARSITVEDLHKMARSEFSLAESSAIKLLHKGRVIGSDVEESRSAPAFPAGSTTKMAKVMVVATSDESVSELNAGRSDPTIRGFDDEKKKPGDTDRRTAWGNAGQDRNYKFCRFEACTWQSFGTRPGTLTPHAFEAMRLLEKLATDPGIVAIMTSRKLVVNTLGEMDPIDDRLMQKKKEEGACLLGYNTNHGFRIDVKLRTNDLSRFLPYHDIASTLIHEISHNWVGPHNALFWTNFGQMRVEYLNKHATLAASGHYIDGKTSAEIAGVSRQCKGGMDTIRESVLAELSKEMANHGIPVQVVAPAVMGFAKDMTIESNSASEGRKLGGVVGEEGSSNGRGNASTRELALAAAERRAKESENDDEQESR